MNFKKLTILAILSSVFFTSCSNDEPEIEKPLGAYDRGVLILNQGGFGNGNASLSYFSYDYATFQNNCFNAVNPSYLLGDTAQDIGFYNNLAFIVLNGSNKIEVVNRYTLIRVATIATGLNNPRYIAFSNGKAFVTNWGNGTSTTDDYIAVINLSNYSFLANIPVIEGPEKIIVANDKLYVAHLGGYGFGNSITVINAINNTISNTIPVADLPTDIEIVGNDMYVLCSGKPSWSGSETNGSIEKVNLNTNLVTSSIIFPTTIHPSNMDIEDNFLYYSIDKAIYKKALTATSLPTSDLLDVSTQGVNGTGIYNFAVKNNTIYVADAGNFSANGKVYTYSLTSVSIHIYPVGVIPAGFYFN